MAMEICEDGCGIPAENMNRIFVRCFSTKKCGTGLGLFVSRMLAERAGGSLEIANRETKGARVIMTFHIARP